VLIDLSYTYLSESCKFPEDGLPSWAEALSYVSLVITIVFVVEMALFAFAFGLGYYLHSFLHFVDGMIIIATFITEVVLKGRERELAELIVMFRLIRFAAESESSFEKYLVCTAYAT
jgi:voltage-gated hydrogen channel 1